MYYTCLDIDDLISFWYNVNKESFSKTFFPDSGVNPGGTFSCVGPKRGWLEEYQGNELFLKSDHYRRGFRRGRPVNKGLEHLDSVTFSIRGTLVWASEWKWNGGSSYLLLLTQELGSTLSKGLPELEVIPFCTNRVTRPRSAGTDV